VMIQLIKLLSLLMIRLRTRMDAMISIEELSREPYVLSVQLRSFGGTLTSEHPGYP